MSALGSLSGEILQKVISELPIRTLCLHRVSKRFNDLENEFFRERCRVYFSSMKNVAPQFYESLVQSMGLQYKLVYIALTGVQFSSDLYPMVKTLAKLTSAQFKTYLEGKVAALREQNLAYQASLKPPTTSQELKTQIETVKREPSTSWSVDDQKKMVGLQCQIMSDPELSEAVQEILRAAKAENSTLPLVLTRKRYPAVVVDYTMHYVKWMKTLPQQNYEQRADVMNRLQQVCEHEETLEDFSTQMFFHILSFLPHLKTWSDHLPKVDQLFEDIDQERRGTAAERLNRIRETLFGLPEPVLEILRDKLHALHGQTNEKHSWFANHFHEHLSDLKFLFRLHFADFHIVKCNVKPKENPILDPAFLFHFLETGLISCQYPHSKPVREELE